jgi:hypothetical protein
MVYVVALCAAAALGLGWVLQQRIAAQVELSEMLSFRMLRDLMRNRVWWVGIAAMAIGQTLAGLALQLGPVTVVAPLLSANLLFAFVIEAVANHRRPGMPRCSGRSCCAARSGSSSRWLTRARRTVSRRGRGSLWPAGFSPPRSQRWSYSANGARWCPSPF